MSDKTNTHSGGIGFFGLLAIVFIVLKLCDVIAWSWWWVLAPLWLPITIILAICAAGLVVAFLSLLAKNVFEELSVRSKRWKESRGNDD